jgi:hypothetical protein
MILEILISTMNRENLSFLDEIFINNENSDFHILIINQTSKENILVSNKERIRVINSFEYGLSKSRNLAIKNAIGDLCLIADDDIEYVKDFDTIIQEAFLRATDVSIMKFKIGTFCGKNYKVYSNGSKILSKKKDIRNISSIEIAFKHHDILKHSIFFNTFFGLGSHFTSGEEYLFLKEALNKGLKIKFENSFVVKHSFQHSTSNMGNDNFVKAQAVIYYHDYKNFSYLFLLKLIIFLVRKSKIKFTDAIAKYVIGVKAIKKYIRLIN